jgi:hypothetical protein
MIKYKQQRKFNDVLKCQVQKLIDGESLSAIKDKELHLHNKKKDKILF